MIPKHLKIKGLYSYQTEQEIDFDPLTDASLFGIFGAVGSGKSSILEAITFALYGDTERLNNKGDDRTYNMMNLRSDELLIDFECIAGKKGERYRFTVRGKRNLKNFKEVKTFDRKAYIWQDEQWVPLPENENAESIIGLSYDNFRRTIIIPQGRFQEFIELRDADRTRMMKELFQLEKYDLSRNVGSLSKQNDLAMSNVDGQLMGLVEVTQEMIEAEEKTREAVKLQIKQTSEDLQVQTTLEAHFLKMKQAHAKISLLKTQLETLESQRAAMTLREQELKAFETCSVHFKSLLDQKKNLETAVVRDQQVQAANLQRISELNVLLEKQKETLLQLKPQYDQREALLDTADELGKVVQILAHKISVEKKKESLTRGEMRLVEKEQSIATLRQQKLEKEAAVDLLKTKVSDIQELGLVKSWFTTLDNLAETRQNVKLEAESLQAEIVKQQEDLLKKTAKLNLDFGLKLENPTLEPFQQAVQQFLSDNDSRQKTLNKQILNINTRLALHQYAGDLEEGVPCPLCGAKHHPAVLHADGAISDELTVCEKELGKLEQQEKSIRLLQTPIERIFTQLENLEKQKGAIKQRYQDAGARIKQHETEFVWQKFDKNNREAFEQYFTETSQAQAAIKEGEAGLKMLSAKIEAELLDKTEKFEKPLQTLRDDILKLENTAATLSEQLQKVSVLDFENKETAAISEQITALKKSYQDITNLFEQTEKQTDTLEKEKNVLSGSQQTLQAALDANQNDLVTLQGNMNLRLAEFSFASEAEVAGILQKNIQVGQERKIIEEFKFAIETTARDLQNLTSENAEAQYDAVRHEEISALKLQLTTALQSLQKEEGGLERLLKKLAEDLAKKVTLLKEKARLQLRKEHLDDLAKLFRSSGFVDYASSIYLQNLIQAANHRFHQMTHQQLHLELGDGNSFWVRDLLNGGHMRLLKTLSGGQKFQAALSLALALADHIHIRNESRHNFFFLDEGFGSLDKNALQTVFETLKSLRKENRIVGIISHVEELQQEIQTYLRVSEGEEGSRIMASWK
ncbi:SbcC/MukB-like Walker B domain-containing protein [Dyadobacter luticola]|uniref:SMC family ATPase n=1 Tax=Dyadobacter luticola TaxID=1979387 RepID=A0A5R9KPY0_9BACT|nr:SMC family ATPase [Dyadobacter luticola]TLU98146.1 SMC family ATPase [Dyadobacter luticola]